MQRRPYLLAMLLACLLIAPAAEARVPLPPKFPTVIHAACPELAIPCYMSGLTQNLAGEWECQDAVAGCIYLPSLEHRFAKWHELGHAFDHQVLDDRDHARFSRLLDTGAVAWSHGPNELFADAYATCATAGDDIRPRRVRGKPVGYVESTSYGYQPSPRRHRRICEAIRFTGLG